MLWSQKDVTVKILSLTQQIFLLLNLICSIFSYFSNWKIIDLCVLIYALQQSDSAMNVGFSMLYSRTLLFIYAILIQ